MAEGRRNSKLFAELDRLIERVKQDEPAAECADPAPEEPAAARRRATVHFDESELVSGYGNAIRSYTTPEEVVLDFAQAIVEGVDRDRNEVHLRVRPEHRVVMSFYGAKRLLRLLEKVLRRYEERFGTIDVKLVQVREDEIEGP